MKFLGMHIKRYGHFTDVPFAFEGDGVQLVLGPNEAGKTTLLEFVRDLLFGFAERNPYDFGIGRIEGTATLRLASGQVVGLHRHKGRKNTVGVKIDGQEAGHDANAFNRLLSGVTANLFRSVFAFGLQELADADSYNRRAAIRAGVNRLRMESARLAGNRADAAVGPTRRHAHALARRRARVAGVPVPAWNSLVEVSAKTLDPDVRDAHGFMLPKNSTVRD